jgi:hypothetical protein
MFFLKVEAVFLLYYELLLVPGVALLFPDVAAARWHLLPYFFANRHHSGAKVARFMHELLYSRVLNF